MYRKQLGRRNLTEEQRTILIGKMLSTRKKRIGQHEGNQYTKVESGKNYQIPHKDKKAVKEGTAGTIARELGVSEKTVRNAEKFADGK